MYRWKFEEEKSYQDTMKSNNVTITAKGSDQLVPEVSNFLIPTHVAAADLSWIDNYWSNQEVMLSIEQVKDDFDLLRAKFIESSGGRNDCRWEDYRKYLQGNPKSGRCKFLQWVTAALKCSNICTVFSKKVSLDKKKLQ